MPARGRPSMRSASARVDDRHRGVRDHDFGEPVMRSGNKRQPPATSEHPTRPETPHAFVVPDEPDPSYRAIQWVAIVLATIVVLLGLAAWDVMGQGLIIVRVRNVGTETLHATTVASDLGGIEVGDLRPGRERLLRMREVVDAIWVRFQWEGGVRDSFQVPVYLMQESKGYMV